MIDMKKFYLTSLAALLFVSCGNTQPQNTNEEVEDSCLVDTTILAPVEEVTEEEENQDPLVGSYRCARTGDVYKFYANGMGRFYVGGGSFSNEFKWQRSGKNVTIVHESFGKEKLKFDEKKETITKNSESYGTIVFDKE